MKPVGLQLYEYIENTEFMEQLTGTGVLISIPGVDHVLQAECTWAETSKGRLHVIYESEMKTFVEALGITTLEDIDTLIPEQLIQLYHEGLADLLCEAFLDCIYYMEFRKKGDVIEVIKERGGKHTIPVCEQMDQPEELIAYAKRFYENMFDFDDN